RAVGILASAEDKIQSLLPIVDPEDIVGQMFVAQGMDREFCIIRTVLYQQNIGIIRVHSSRSIFVVCIRLGELQAAQGEIEGRAFIQFRFHPHPTLVFLDNSLYRGQAYAGAFKLFGSMEALKYSEKLVGVFHVEPNAVVADEKGAFRGLSVFDDRKR